MRFEALELSIDLIRQLRAPVVQLRRRDPDLEKQIRRSASGISLSVAEGQRRTGKDRLYHYRVAAGSAAETHTALRVAEAWGYLEARLIEKPLSTLDRILGLLWGLGH